MTDRYAIRLGQIVRSRATERAYVVRAFSAYDVGIAEAYSLARGDISSCIRVIDKTRYFDEYRYTGDYTG